MTELASVRPEPVGPNGRKLNIKTVEVLGQAVFRALFRDGVRIPLKMNGMMDMDLLVQDNNIVLNMNHIKAEVPQLSVWRITFAYHNKPVIEYGRGVKGDMKIHFGQAFFLFVEIWKEKRRKSRAKARGDVVVDRELVTMTADGLTAGSAQERPN
jgi:hypothetical protein